jgi:hypothetical protein
MAPTRPNALARLLPITIITSAVIRVRSVIEFTKFAE